MWFGEILFVVNFCMKPEPIFLYELFNNLFLILNSFQIYSSERDFVEIGGKDLAMIVGPAAVGLVVIFLIGFFAFFSVARKKRSLHGTYSPQKQEFNAPRLELSNMTKIPPVERLI